MPQIRGGRGKPNFRLVAKRARGSNASAAMLGSPPGTSASGGFVEKVSFRNDALAATTRSEVMGDVQKQKGLAVMFLVLSSHPDQELHVATRAASEF
jgi:hypothetical protein